jgi:hypothetical protein
MTTPILMLVLMMAPYLVVRLVSTMTGRDCNAQRVPRSALLFYSFLRASDISSTQNP